MKQQEAVCVLSESGFRPRPLSSNAAATECAPQLALRASACWQAGLSWVTGRLEWFLPSDFNQQDQLQEITELCLLYGHAVTCLPEDPHGKIARIGEFLISFLGSGEAFANKVMAVPSQYNPYLLIYLPLRAIGVRLPAFEEAIRRLRRMGYPAAMEIFPYREMELNYLTWKAGLQRRKSNWRRAYRSTVLYRGCNPIYFSLNDVYSVTHTLIYLTDFGRSATAFEDHAECERAIGIVEPLLVHYWREPNWDLTGELLINLVGLTHFDTPLFAAAFTSLMNVWRQDGTLPGPNFCSQGGEPDEKVIFRDCYHTTLVGMLLSAAYLYRGTGASK